ncbi:MAG: hypothetical protein ACR2PL_25365 [Dehalococcoidia bacterium]
MRCWKCGHTADGICQFCGRGVCKRHYAETNAIISAFIDNSNGQRIKALVTVDALYCGFCKPQPQPVDLPNQ